MAEAEFVIPLHYGLIHNLTGHTDIINSVKFSPNGKWLLSASEDTTIKMWDVATGNLIKNYPNSGHAVNEVDWSTDNNLVVTGTDDTHVKLWDVHRGKLLSTFVGHTGFVSGCKFNSQGTLIASTSYDQTMRVWDTRTGNTIMTTPEQGCPASCVIFNKEGTQVIHGNFAGFCDIWDMGEARLLSRIESNNAAVTSIKLLPGDKWLLMVSSNDTISLWNTKDLIVKTYRGHTNHELLIKGDYCVDSKASTHVVCGSENNHVYIWNFESQAIEQTLEGHNSAIICASCHPFEEMIAATAYRSDSQDQFPIKIWKNN